MAMHLILHPVFKFKAVVFVVQTDYTMVHLAMHSAVTFSYGKQAKS